MKKINDQGKIPKIEELRKIGKESMKQEFFEECQMKAIRKITEQYCYDMIMKNPEILREFIPKDKIESVTKYVNRRNGNRYKFAMFTINLKKQSHYDQLYMDELKKKIFKACHKKWIDDYSYCYETRGDSTGLHIHIKVWINKDKKPCECSREMYNTFKNLVESKLHVNTVFSNREKAFDDYIKGIKDGKKKDNHENDKKFRHSWGLLNTY